MLKRLYTRIYRHFRPRLPYPEAFTAQEISNLNLNLKKGDIVIDCGANIGTVTGILAGTGATIHAFEPNPYAYARLERTFRYYRNVHCYNKAVSHENGVVDLFLHEQAEDDQVKWSQGSSLLAEKANVNESNSVAIPSVDLAEFVKSFNRRVQFVKVDIEGAEYRTIEHMIETGAINNVDLIWVETHHKRHPYLLPQYERLKGIIEQRDIDNLLLTFPE